MPHSTAVRVVQPRRFGRAHRIEVYSGIIARPGYPPQRIGRRRPMAVGIVLVGGRDPQVVRADSEGRQCSHGGRHPPTLPVVQVVRLPQDGVLPSQDLLPARKVDDPRLLIGDETAQDDALVSAFVDVAQVSFPDDVAVGIVPVLRPRRIRSYPPR